MRRTFLAMVGVLAILSLAIPGDSPKASADDCKKCEPEAPRSTLSLEGTGTPGLWITNKSDKNKGTIAIYNCSRMGPVIGFYSNDDLSGKKKPMAMSLALHLDQDGNPCIQVYGADNTIRHIDLVKLAKMVESCKRCQCTDCPDCKKCPTK